MSPIDGKTILVTGGTGSFGTRLVEKLLPSTSRARCASSAATS